MMTSHASCTSFKHAPRVGEHDVDLWRPDDVSLDDVAGRVDAVHLPLGAVVDVHLTVALDDDHQTERLGPRDFASIVLKMIIVSTCQVTIAVLHSASTYMYMHAPVHNCLAEASNVCAHKLLPLCGATGRRRNASLTTYLGSAQNAYVEIRSVARLRRNERFLNQSRRRQAV